MWIMSGMSGSCKCRMQVLASALSFKVAKSKYIYKKYIVNTVGMIYVIPSVGFQER